MSLSEDLLNNNLILLTATKEKYRDSLKLIYQELSKSFDKIGYITVNKPFSNVMDTLSKNNLNVNKFYFVDAITATVKAPPIVGNCMFVSSPTALTDIGLAFTSLMTEKNCDIIFFDTISTLIIYQDIGSVIKFTHNLITKASVMGKKAVFLAVKEDSEALIKDLNMFVDKIVEI
jgi:hypothetical protein